ncbi:hypothetical protein [Leptospira neocaledonica]|uniref:Uncharacterized protein n=1 Tax=Leptospira neocaledonica TaxID=2023192 RepID=A0A2N0A215_9LEPT|nr:hypothetical protein [Leptospira neocaledonica]PJZ78193.1 hypothetical protein CH365_02460 [Leptospira neocaledonica]
MNSIYFNFHRIILFLIILFTLSKEVFPKNNNEIYCGSGVKTMYSSASSKYTLLEEVVSASEKKVLLCDSSSKLTEVGSLPFSDSLVDGQFIISGNKLRSFNIVNGKLIDIIDLFECKAGLKLSIVASGPQDEILVVCGIEGENGFLSEVLILNIKSGKAQVKKAIARMEEIYKVKYSSGKYWIQYIDRVSDFENTIVLSRKDKGLSVFIRDIDAIGDTIFILYGDNKLQSSDKKGKNKKEQLLQFDKNFPEKIIGFVNIYPIILYNNSESFEVRDGRLINKGKFSRFISFANFTYKI